MVHAEELAVLMNAEPVTELDLVKKNADLYVLAIADDALPGVAAKLSLADKLVIHTAGSVSKEVLRGISNRYGVLWPIKMIRESEKAISPAHIIIDGNTAAVIDSIRQIALTFSASVSCADDTARAKMHMIAALTTNFSNHLYHLATDYCEKEGIAFSYFYPLIEAAVQQVKNLHPAETQAGPAFRGDWQTINKHRELLASYPQIAEVYEVITKSIIASFAIKS
jgi:predicted short-subunit dehydrogenase-like oxidoreductase (DUF2520 family)